MPSAWCEFGYVHGRREKREGNLPRMPRHHRTYKASDRKLSEAPQRYRGVAATEGWQAQAGLMVRARMVFLSPVSVETGTFADQPAYAAYPLMRCMISVTSSSVALTITSPSSVSFFSVMAI